MFLRPEHCPDQRPRPLPGDLLVAAAGSSDDNFAGSVVLLVEANDWGACGVVLNQPLCGGGGCEVEDVLPGWGELASTPPVLFRGGPVQPDGAVCLAVLAKDVAPPPGWRSIRGRLGVVNLEMPPADVEGYVDGIRVFVGYAGWDAGQLDAELERGWWYLVPGELEDVVRREPTNLWRESLRRMRCDVALFSTWTPYPELN